MTRGLYAALVARFMHGWRRVLCFVCGCFALSANAQWLPGHDYTLDRAGNVIHVRGPSITTPSYIVSGTPAGALITSNKSFEVAGHKASIQAAKTIPWKNVAKGLKVVGRVNPYSMAAGFAVDWLIDNNWRVIECVNNAASCDGLAQWQRKDERASLPTNANLDYRYSQNSSYPWRAASGSVISSDIVPYFTNAFASCTPTTSPSNCRSILEVECTNSDCTAVRIDARSPKGVAEGTAKWSQNDTYHADMYTRPKTIPGGGSSDWVDSPPPDFDKDPPNPPHPDKAPDIWGKGLPGGIPDSAGGPTVSGPSSTPGGSSTTTGPTGTVTTTITNNYTYQGDTITITESKTTTTTSPSGDVTTEETVSDKPPDKEDVDPCKANPDALGCIKLGEVPDETIEKVTRHVAVSAEAVNLPSQCPAPITAAGYSLSFDAACDFSEGVHPFILAAAALMAAMIVIRSIQGA